MIRLLDNNDFIDLQNLFSQLYDIHYKNRPDTFNNAHPITKEYFQEILTSTCKHCYVYLDQGKMLGAILIKEYETDDYVTLKKRKIYEIYDIVVNKDFRNKGIGKKLYNYITELAQQNGINTIIVEVFTFNEDAIHFYQSIGMTARKIIYENILSPYDIEKGKQNIVTTNKTIKNNKK
ncbi:MAG: GNAT family N-acetyltransferase [Clostridia bacterium]|nr:GNAT family N-acetyltransferase [Clostridia bacterium]